MSITLSLLSAVILLISFVLITGMHLIGSYYLKWSIAFQDTKYTHDCLRYVKDEGSKEQLQAYEDLILKKNKVKSFKTTFTQYKVVYALGVLCIVILVLYAFTGLISAFYLMHDLIEFDSPTADLLTLPLTEELLRSLAFSFLSLFLAHLINMIALASYKRYKNLELLEKMESKN